jgi:hypothetical protein
MVRGRPYLTVTKGLFLTDGVFRQKGLSPATYLPPCEKYRFGYRPASPFPEVLLRGREIALDTPARHREPIGLSSAA